MPSTRTAHGSRRPPRPPASPDRGDPTHRRREPLRAWQGSGDVRMTAESRRAGRRRGLGRPQRTGVRSRTPHTPHGSSQAGCRKGVTPRAPAKRRDHSSSSSRSASSRSTSVVQSDAVAGASAIVTLPRPPFAGHPLARREPHRSQPCGSRRSRDGDVAAGLAIERPDVPDGFSHLLHALHEEPGATVIHDLAQRTARKRDHWRAGCQCLDGHD